MPKFRTTFLTKQDFILNLHLDLLVLLLLLQLQRAKRPSTGLLYCRTLHQVQALYQQEHFFPPIIKVNERRTYKKVFWTMQFKNIFNYSSLDFQVPLLEYCEHQSFQTKRQMQDLYLINCHKPIRDLESFLPVPFCDQTWITHHYLETRGTYRTQPREALP